MFTNLMIDLETGVQSPGCVVYSLGAVAFDANGLGPEFYSVISVSSSESLGLKFDPSTTAWWDKQSEAARQVLRDAADPKAPSVYDAIKNFNAWLVQFNYQKVKIWGNGSDFDNPILTAVYKAAGFDAPWLFYNNRCYRTLKNLFKDTPMPARQGTYHNALDDAKTQATHAVDIFYKHGFR